MFEWLKNLLFDEEEVVVEEKKLEKIDFTKVNDLDHIMSEKPLNQKTEHSEEIIKESVEETPVSIKKDFNIQIEEAPKKEEIKVKKSERSVSERKEKDIEINSVISPMFGSNTKKSVENVKMESAPVKKKDGLGTIISPMYGQAELIVHEKEAIEKIEKNQKEMVPLMEDDDWKNDIPIEELITNEEENEDCVQFSLFGDATEIKE